LSTSFSFNLSTSVVPRARKVFPTTLVEAVKASLNVEEHQIGDFFTISENNSEWVGVRLDLPARETALCTMLLASLALGADAEILRPAYNCSTLPTRGVKAPIALGFHVAFGDPNQSRSDVEAMESVRNEKLTSWRNARNGVGTSVGTTTPATSTSVGTTEEAEGPVKL
jgi:hypothetical protein